MVSEGAAKTKFMLAMTSNSWYYTTELTAPDSTINSIFAIWSRTPLKVFFIIHVGTSQQLVVSEGEERNALVKSHIR